MNRRPWFVAALTGLAGVAIAFAGTAPVASAEKTPKILKCGATMPLTGPGSPWGIPITRVAKIHAEIINDRGGVEIDGQTYHFEVLVEDDKYTAEGGRAAAEKLIYTDKVNFMFGSFASSAVDAIAPIITREKIIYIAGGTGLHQVKPEYPYYFRSVPIGADFGMAFAAIYSAYPKIKRVAFLAPDDASGHSVKDIPMPEGMEVVSMVFHPRGTMDFHSYLAKIGASKPDMLQGGGSPGECAMIIKQAHEMGFTWRHMMLGTLTHVGDFLKMAGREAAQGLFVQDPKVWLSPNVSDYQKGIANEIRARFEKQYGQPLEYSGWASYTAQNFSLLVEALKKAKSLDPQKIIETLRTQEFDTLMGKVKASGEKTLGIKNHFRVPMMMGEIQGDKLVYIGEWSGPPLP